YHSRRHVVSHRHWFRYYRRGRTRLEPRRHRVAVTRGAANRAFGQNAGKKEIFSLNRRRLSKRPSHDAPLHAVIIMTGQCGEAAPRADATPAPAGFFFRELNAQREQRDCADPYDQDHQRHRVVVEPMPALYTHDAPRPERPTHSSPESP